VAAVKRHDLAVPSLLELAADAATPERGPLLDRLRGIAGADEDVLPRGAPERYRRDLGYAAVAEGVPLFGALLADDELAGYAAALLAWFPGRADAALLWARLDGAPPALAGTCLAAIGLLDGDAARLAPFVRDADPVRRWGAAIALARVAGADPPDGVLDELLLAARGEVPALEPPGVVFMSGAMHRYAAASLPLLDPATHPAVVERIARSLSGVDAYAGMTLVDTMLALAFSAPVPRGTPFAALEPHQQQALRGLLTARWFVMDTGFANVALSLDSFGLPVDARGLDAYIRGKRGLR
jgi:hypothetical protein